MKWLGKRVKSHSYCVGAEWNYVPARIVCPADTVGKQIECLYYTPDESWWCVYCESGTSDLCSLTARQTKEET